MNLSQQLATRFTEVILYGKWVANTNYREQLDSLDWRMAVRSVGSSNSVGVLAQHIHYYIAGVIQVLEGGPLTIRDAYSFDFPPITSQKQWEDFLMTFWKDAELFASLVAQLPESQWEESFVDEKYGTYLRNIEGMIEHCYYHLGQIVLLKKLVLANT
ncbi:MAG: DUF1572 domain-containing protein [Flavobacteriaceae bacterium]